MADATKPEVGEKAKESDVLLEDDDDFEEFPKEGVLTVVEKLHVCKLMIVS